MTTFDIALGLFAATFLGFGVVIAYLAWQLGPIRMPSLPPPPPPLPPLKNGEWVPVGARKKKQTQSTPSARAVAIWQASGCQSKAEFDEWQKELQRYS